MELFSLWKKFFFLRKMVNKMWRYCGKNSDVIWYCESQCEQNSSHIVTHIVRRLWGNCEWRWIPSMFWQVLYSYCSQGAVRVDSLLKIFLRKSILLTHLFSSVNVTLRSPFKCKASGESCLCRQQLLFLFCRDVHGYPGPGISQYNSRIKKYRDQKSRN